jgi:hypothetical protein
MATRRAAMSRKSTAQVSIFVPVAAAMRAAVLAIRSPSMSIAATRALCAAKAATIASPMPDAPPVTSTGIPARSG